jgi:hypothetical protein
MIAPNPSTGLLLVREAREALRRNPVDAEAHTILGVTLA